MKFGHDCQNMSRYLTRHGTHTLHTKLPRAGCRGAWEDAVGRYHLLLQGMVR